MLSQHGKLVNCSLDSELVTAAEIALVLGFVSQMQNPKLYVTVNVEVKPAAIVVIDESAALMIEKMATQSSPRLKAMQVPPSHTLLFVLTTFESHLLYEMCCQLP